MKKQTIIIAAASLLAFGIQAGDKSPAILKNISAKQGVQVLQKGKMSEVRGEAIIPLTLGNTNLTVRLLEPNTVLRLTTQNSNPGNPGSSTSNNILGLIQLNNTQPASPATTTTSELGVLDRGQLLQQTNITTVNP